MSEEQSKPGDEIVNLNADDLDVEELDDETLSNAAGGAADGCWDMTCGTFRRAAEDQQFT